MYMFLTTVTIVMYVVVVMCASVVPLGARYSAYERTRRQKNGEADIARDIQRDATRSDVAGVLRVIGALALVIFILLALTAFGWLYGAIVAVAGVLCYGALARVPFIHQVSQQLYLRCELQLLNFVERNQKVFRFFRTVPADNASVRIGSRDELVFTVENLPGILSKEEQRLLVSGLQFGNKQVESAMTPRSVLDVVREGDTVGPLLLDELHKTGHSRFPIVDEDVDHVVGILHIQNLLKLQDKKTHHARDIMTSPVYYIKESQTLGAALAAFLRTHHHMFIVVNEYRETVGVLTLEDVIEALIGRKIIDEFDTHDDLRAVAARNPRGNNTPTKHTDV